MAFSRAARLGAVLRALIDAHPAGVRSSFRALSTAAAEAPPNRLFMGSGMFRPGGRRSAAAARRRHRAAAAPMLLTSNYRAEAARPSRPSLY